MMRRLLTFLAGLYQPPARPGPLISEDGKYFVIPSEAVEIAYMVSTLEALTHAEGYFSTDAGELFGEYLSGNMTPAEVRAETVATIAEAEAEGAKRKAAKAQKDVERMMAA